MAYSNRRINESKMSWIWYHSFPIDPSLSMLGTIGQCEFLKNKETEIQY